MSNAIDEVATLTADLRAWIEWQYCLGASALPRETVPDLAPLPVPRARASPQRTRPPQKPRMEEKPSQPQVPRATVSSESSPKTGTDQSAISDKWKALMAAPTTHHVSGPLGAQVMVVRGSGSSPEAESMLDRMLENVLGIERSNVCVVDLHRDTRSPAAIGDGFRRALPELNPTLVVAMGRFAVQALYGEEASLDSLRGKWLDLPFDGGGASLRVTHHPEAILLLSARGQTAPKREAFVDLKAVGDKLTST